MNTIYIHIYVSIFLSVVFSFHVLFVFFFCDILYFFNSDTDRCTQITSLFLFEYLVCVSLSRIINTLSHSKCFFLKKNLYHLIIVHANVFHITYASQFFTESNNVYTVMIRSFSSLFLLLL